MKSIGKKRKDLDCLNGDTEEALTQFLILKVARRSKQQQKSHSSLMISFKRTKLNTLSWSIELQERPIIKVLGLITAAVNIPRAKFGFLNSLSTTALVIIVPIIVVDRYVKINLSISESKLI